MTNETAGGGMAVIVAIVLLGIGSLASLGGSIWLLVRAFQTSLGWGLAVFFLPFANIVFLIKHWVFAKKPFLLSVAGVVLVIVGSVMLTPGRMSAPNPARNEAANARAQSAARRAEARKKGTPKSDREKVAVMLADAGIDPANPRTFQGRTIEALTAAMGAPSANMKVGGTTTYIFHNCFEVESADGGKTVSGVHYMGE